MSNNALYGLVMMGLYFSTGKPKLPECKLWCFSDLCTHTGAWLWQVSMFQAV